MPRTTALRPPGGHRLCAALDDRLRAPFEREFLARHRAQLLGALAGEVLQRRGLSSMDREALRQYLLTVAKEGYANPEKERQWVKEPDGSTTITHRGRPFTMHDNFFGGEPYGGRQVVFCEDKPLWMMVYYGVVAKDRDDVRGVYSFLQQAMANPDEATPLRGPRQFERDPLRYETSWQGDILGFNGVETISQDGETLYTAWYSGGLVDTRRE